MTHILLIDAGCSWELPRDLVLPGEILTDAVCRTASGVGIDIDDVTGYLGHHDLLAGDDVVHLVAHRPRRLPVGRTR